ncbi:MAG: DUF4145 domain-containing protein [Bacteroidales bacterium]|nr:DUF4145 domain-containing protein [Bacteroidales bacterium]
MMKEKYFCRNCKGLRNHKLIHEVKTRGGDDNDYFQWIRKYSIIECLGCETVSFLEIYGDTEMIAHNEDGEPDYYFDNYIYPLYLEESEELEYVHYIPDSIKVIYRETISAFKTNSYILTAGGLRAIIEAICNHLKIKKGNLADRIDLLHNKGHLTLSESKRLHSIRFLGNDALHEIEKPKKDHLFILLDIVNHLLSNLFINDKILKGKLETIIDKYDEYIKLIRNKIDKDMIGKEFSMREILGKSIRLIPKTEYKKLEDEFKKEINSGEIDYVSIIKEPDESIYKIEKEPEFVFDW